MPDEKRQLLLAGEDKHPISLYTQKKTSKGTGLWDAMLAHTGMTEEEFSQKHTLYSGGNEVPCTYGRICKELRDKDRDQKLVIYDEDGQSVYRIWNLPVNKRLTPPTDIKFVTKVVLG